MDRSDPLVLTAYFLSRCGPKDPPPQLAARSWRHAYLCFYAALADGRSHRSFHNTLKSSRDEFDGHLTNARTGWQKPLPDQNRRIMNRWASRSDAELWEAVKPWADLRAANIPTTVLDDLEAEPKDVETVKVGHEGTQTARVTTVRERDPALRAMALEHHGTRCQVCDFDFGQVYGDWGRGFAEVHHLEMLSDASKSGTLTDPTTDLAVLCANCHRMIHRKRGRALTLDELREMIDEARRGRT